MLAYIYPVLSIFWSMLIFFGFVIWIYLLFVIFADLFRSSDVGGFAKAMWTLGLLFLPLVGVLLYLVVRGGGMQERSEEQAAERQAAFEQYIRDTAASPPAPPRVTSPTDGTPADRNADKAARP